MNLELFSDFVGTLARIAGLRYNSRRKCLALVLMKASSLVDGTISLFADGNFLNLTGQF